MNDYPQDKYDKAKGQLKLQLNGVFRPFHMHGMKEFVPDAIDECVYLAEQFAMRVRGKDSPIRIRKKYRT